MAGILRFGGSCAWVEPTRVLAPLVQHWFEVQVQHWLSGTSCAHGEFAHPVAKHFEAMAAGAAVVTEARLVPQLASLGLVAGVHYIACNESEAALVATLKFWLDMSASGDDVQLRRIADSGRKAVLRRFRATHEVHAALAAMANLGSTVTLCGGPTVKPQREVHSCAGSGEAGSGVLLPSLASHWTSVPGLVGGVQELRTAKIVFLVTQQDLFLPAFKVLQHWVWRFNPAAVVYSCSCSEETVASMTDQLQDQGLIVFVGNTWRSPVPGVPYIVRAIARMRCQALESVMLALRRYTMVRVTQVVESEQPSGSLSSIPTFQLFLREAKAVWAPCSTSIPSLQGIRRERVWSVPVLLGLLRQVQVIKYHASTPPLAHVACAQVIGRKKMLS